MKHIKRLHPETGSDNAAASVAAAAAAAGIISPGASGSATQHQVIIIALGGIVALMIGVRVQSRIALY